MDNNEDMIKRWGLVNEASMKMALTMTKRINTLPKHPMTDLLIRDVTETHNMLMEWEKSEVPSQLTPKEALYIGKVIGRLEALYAILSKMVVK